MAQIPSPSSADTGTIIQTQTGPAHHRAVRVYFEDTDLSSFVYHARYLHFFERGRTDYLRCLGFHQADMAAAGADAGFFVVHWMNLAFQTPARMDDALNVITMCINLTGARVTMKQTIARDGVEIVTADVGLACVRPDGAARRIPRELQSALTQHLVQPG